VLADRPLGVVGAVVSANVVTVTGALGVEALYRASNAVTRNVTVCPGRSDDQVAVVCGCATDTTPDRPSPQREYDRTPTLSVDWFHAKLTLVWVTAVTRRLEGWLGGVRSVGGGRPADAGAVMAMGSARAARALAAMRTNPRRLMNCLLRSWAGRSPVRHYAQIEDAVLGDSSSIEMR
jgi:hypothetical protein